MKVIFYQTGMGIIPTLPVGAANLSFQPQPGTVLRITQGKHPDLKEVEFTVTNDQTLVSNVSEDVDVELPFLPEPTLHVRVEKS